MSSLGAQSLCWFCHVAAQISKLSLVDGRKFHDHKHLLVLTVKMEVQVLILNFRNISTS